MTPLDLAMKAGRELDALVAEKVMGWHQNVDLDYKPPQWEWYSVVNGFSQFERLVNHPEQLGGLKLWCPSTDIAAAWEVVEKLRGEYEMELEDRQGEWSTWFRGFDVLNGWRVYRTPVFNAIADTAPLSICIAALKAVEARA